MRPLRPTALALATALGLMLTPACADTNDNPAGPGPGDVAADGGNTDVQGDVLGGGDTGESDGTGADAAMDGGPTDAVGDEGPGDTGSTDTTSDTLTDADTDTTQTTSCGTALTPPGDGSLCTTTAGNDDLFLEGNLILPDGILEGGGLLIQGGVLTCVGCDCANAPGANAATHVVCAEGVVSPGLINPHDHITFDQQGPIDHGDERYDHRHEWRKGKNGHTKLTYYQNSHALGDAWGEMRQVMLGATSLFGSGGQAGFMRNLDKSNLLEGLSHEPAKYSTFPLGDSNGAMYSSGCTEYNYDNPNSVASENAYVPHVAEGIAATAENEFLCVDGSDADGVDFVEPNAAFIHGIGLTTADIAVMATNGTGLVWSPRSNVSLYGMTANVPVYDRLGALIALGSDWTPSGSMNMVRELACADRWNRDYFDHYFTDAELVAMVTTNAAQVLGFGDVLGSLVQGKAADVTVWDGRVHTGYRAILDAETDGVALVLRGGLPLYGDDTLVAALADTQDCETLDVCGSTKRICAQREIGTTVTALQGEMDQWTYPLFFCGPEPPADEPTCVPMRPNEFDGQATATDGDGDGVPDAQDLCPTVFNPPRPLEGNVQMDADGDGLGDECDPCPFDADTTACSSIDPLDIDGDGVQAPTDNCPNTANADQADADGDGTGDACDACPDFANPGGGACPATIYDIKQGVVSPGEGALVQGALVTASVDTAFWMQVDPASAGYAGPEFSGIYVYNPAGGSPPVGARVDVNGTVNDFYGQIQLEGPTITVVDPAAGTPAPTVVASAEVGKAGANAAAYEGLLITVENVEVTDDNPAGETGETVSGEFVVTGDLTVDDYFYLIDPTPAVGVIIPSITGVVRYSWNRNKLEPRSAEDVVLGAPGLLSLTPDTAYLYAGQTGTTSPALTVRLTNTSPDPVTVAVTSSDETLATVVSGGVTIPAGSLEGQIELQGLSAGTVTLTATLDNDSLQANVTILDATTIPVPVALEPATATMATGSTATFTVTLDLPAPPAGLTLDVTATGLADFVAPATVDFQPGAFSATFDVTAGTTAGDATIEVSDGTNTVSATASVTEAQLYGLMLVEVFLNPDGLDDGKEWVRLYNGSGSDIDLSTWSLGWGGNDYTYGTMQLSGTIAAGDCFVVGGPTSDASNGSPVYDLAQAFSPGIQNQKDTADGIALFDVTAGNITASTVPVDALIYGTNNTNNLLSPDGTPGTPNVATVPSGTSVVRTGPDSWESGLAPNASGCIVIQ